LLAAITRVEFQKRYAGSVLGVSWLVLQPALLLSVYLFVYLVVFKVRFPGFSEMDFVVFVFAGLVPFLGTIEATNGAALSIKANMHLVKNVMLPTELVPVRTVPVAMTVGELEENAADNRVMARALAAQGYPVALHEARDLHNYTAWRDGWDPHLTRLLKEAWQ